MKWSMKWPLIALTGGTDEALWDRTEDHQLKINNTEDRKCNYSNGSGQTTSCNCVEYI